MVLATTIAIKNKSFTLFVHNGIQSKSIPIQFDNNTRVIKAIERNNLFSGINIFTLFNDKDQPVLERVFFNYEGIEIFKTAKAFVTKNQDSLSVQVPVNGLTASEVAHLSVSILPNDTKSYNTDHNIISYTLLQPYVKGYIENAKYYFQNINISKIIISNVNYPTTILILSISKKKMFEIPKFQQKTFPVFKFQFSKFSSFIFSNFQNALRQKFCPD